MNFQSLFLARVALFQSENTDINGKPPVILSAVAGKFPNRIVLAGTVAENMGIEVGSTYLFSCRETEASEDYGRQFRFQALGKPMSALEIIEASEKLGKPTILNLDVEQETLPVMQVEEV